MKTKFKGYFKNETDWEIHEFRKEMIRVHQLVKAAVLNGRKVRESK